MVSADAMARIGVASLERLGVRLVARMYRIGLRIKSVVDVKMPRTMASRSTFLKHSSIWLSEGEQVGVKCRCALGCRRGKSRRGGSCGRVGLSRMTWISRRLGCAAAKLARKAKNASLVVVAQFGRAPLASWC